MAIALGSKKYAKAKTPKAAARRSVDDQTVIENGSDAPLTVDERRERLKGVLCDLVNNRIREAVSARETSGIEDEWREAEDLYQGIDEVSAGARGGMAIRDKTGTPSRKSRDGSSQSTLLLNITKPKTKVATARVKEMLVPNNDRPWNVEPSPIPDLDQVTKNPELAGQNITLGDGSQAPALAVAEIMRTRASEASKGEADWIEDRFVEGKVYAELRHVIDDAARIGTGVLKGPFPACRKTRRFTVDPVSRAAQMVMNETYPPTSRRIRLQDAYPDPACGDNIHNGSYFVERDFLTTRAIRDLAKTEGYDVAAVADAILEGPQTYAMMRSSGLKDRRKPGDMVKESSLFEVFYVYLDLPPESLIAMGVKDALLGNDATVEEGSDASGDGLPSDAPEETGETPPTDDEQAEPDRLAGLTRDQRAALVSIPAMVTMLNGKAIKAVVQPLESGEFPYDFFPWEVVDGQPWGRGVPISMRAAQVILKSGVRRLLENAGMSAGPQIAYVAGAMRPVNDIFEITGRKLWEFTPTELIDDVRKAMAMFEIPSMQKELLEIIKFALEMADQLTNIPMLLQGDQQAGTSPETLGGMRMLMNNSLSPLRDIAKQYDDFLIIPHLGRYHEWFMTHEPDKPKGDSEIKALGSTALVQREEGRMFLAMLAPVKDDPAYRIDPAKFSKELARANGYDMSLIQYSEDDWKKAQQAKAQQPPLEAPAVQAAKVRAASAEKIAGEKGQRDMTAERARSLHEEEDRKLRVEELRLRTEETATKERLAEIELAMKTGAGLEDIRAKLAMKAGELRLQREEMQLKMSPANPSHTGI